ncbi:MAG: MMPL family transporter [Proteobacteria bacterium]|nr:MMPL family transporter [Pseudomonadota bacterium]
MTRPNVPAKAAPFGDRFVDFIATHPRKALAAGLMLLALLVPGLGKLQADFSYRIWFDEDDPHLARFDAFERRFGNDEAIAVIMHSPSGIFDVESAATLVALTEGMWQVSEVIRVESLSNFNWAHAHSENPDELIIEPLIPEDLPHTAELLASRRVAALEHETIPGFLVSRDGRTALVVGWLQPGLQQGPRYDVAVAEVQALLRRIGQGDGNDIGDHSFHVTGLPAMTVAFEQANEYDFSRILPVVLLLCITLLFVIFRRAAGVLLPLLVAFTATIAALATAGWLGIKLNNITFVVPEFLIAVAIADSVHILTKFFGSPQMNRTQAAHHALRVNLIPTIITTLSTAIGFFSFSGAKVAPVADLGLLSAVGTIYAWIFSYALCGPLLVLMPMARRAAPTRARGGLGLSVRWVNGLYGYRKGVLVAFLVLVCGAGWLAAGNRVNSDPYSYLPGDHPLNLATDVLQKELGQAMGIEIVVESGRDEGIKDPDFLRKVDGFAEWIRLLPRVGAVNSFIDIVKSMNRALHGGQPAEYRLPDTRREIAEYQLLYSLSLPAGQSLNDRVSLRNDAVRMTVHWGLRQSVPTLAQVERIERKAEEMGLQAHVTGKSLLYQRLNPYVVQTFLTSIAIALVVVSALLMVFFSSVRLGLLALIPNTVPLVIGAGVLHALGRSLDVGTVVVFATCLGIAVDDTVHLLAAYNESAQRRQTPVLGLARVLHTTAPALIITTAILAAAFATFGFSVFVPNFYFGIMIAIILGVALITDLTLLPVLLMWREHRRPIQTPGTAGALAAGDLQDSR